MNTKNRRSIRLPVYDYSQPGAYHVTICVNQVGAFGQTPIGQTPISKPPICHSHLLGQIEDGKMSLNDLGHIAHQGWEWLPGIFPVAAVDIFCVMPNHVHAIIRIKPIAGRGDLQIAPTMQNGPKTGSLPTAPTTGGIIKSKPLGRLVGAYKTHTTIAINKHLNTPGVKFWQRNYYERVIRNEREYAAVWAYIENNPANWTEDENYFD